MMLYLSEALCRIGTRVGQCMPCFIYTQQLGLVSLPLVLGRSQDSTEAQGQEDQ